MRFGGGLISTGFTLSGIDGVLRLLMDDPPTEFEGEDLDSGEFEGEDFEGESPEAEHSKGTASLDPRLRGYDGRGEP
jgi:hypothetical protein